jgi:hypothetical protein
MKMVWVMPSNMNADIKTNKKFGIGIFVVVQRTPVGCFLPCDPKYEHNCFGLTVYLMIR